MKMVEHHTQLIIFQKVEMKDYNVMMDGRNFFDQPINSMNKPYENIRKIATGKGDDYTTGCLLDYPYFKQNYKILFSLKESLTVIANFSHRLM